MSLGEKLGLEGELGGVIWFEGGRARVKVGGDAVVEGDDGGGVDSGGQELSLSEPVQMSMCKSFVVSEKEDA